MINYYLLTKPGIILGNLLTVAAGFILALEAGFNTTLFLATLIGLALVIASACVFNNCIDRKIDSQMKRTANRPLAKGKISVANAILFGIILGFAGILILISQTNFLTAAIAASGFLIYVLIYSFYKSQTIYATAIGSLAGGVPPLVGYCAVSGRVDLGALLFFALMFFWQMPHFFAIAIFHKEDYSAAKIPALPLIKGSHVAKVRMVSYVAGFMLTLLALTLYHYTGLFSLLCMLAVAGWWFYATFQGFKIREENEKVWARKMFRISLVVITVFSLMIPLEHFFF